MSSLSWIVKQIYKSCIIDDSNSFNFLNQDLINEFDSEIKNNYPDKLNQMNKLISYYFEIKNEPIMNKLVRSILDLIKNDTSIPNNAKFYITPDGKPTLTCFTNDELDKRFK